jgi:hypothetical protein
MVINLHYDLEAVTRITLAIFGHGSFNNRFKQNCPASLMFPTSPSGILKTVFILSAFDRLGKFFQKGLFEVTGS